MKRRDFLKLLASATPLAVISKAGAGYESDGYAMLIDVSKCIGCGNCVIACKIENDVPMDFKFSRTWIEGYVVERDLPPRMEKVVLSTDENPFLSREWRRLSEGKKTFYVPKLCNHCANAPCVNVCPVYARFYTKEGVVLVDKDTCIGCKYCIVACPYGATFVHPEQRVTDKCTFCYHRIKRGLKPACVLACPTGARVFGRASEIEDMTNGKRVSVLKPELGTFPRVVYVNLDTVVE
ncbi:MAG: 4Fe-4S dicluster domain-containing protein [Archaeoglobaceae archaeon]